MSRNLYKWQITLLLQNLLVTTTCYNGVCLHTVISLQEKTSVHSTVYIWVSELSLERFFSSIRYFPMAPEGMIIIITRAFSKNLANVLLFRDVSLGEGLPFRTKIPCNTHQHKSWHFGLHFTRTRPWHKVKAITKWAAILLYMYLYSDCWNTLTDLVNSTGVSWFLCSKWQRKTLQIHPILQQKF